MTPLRYSIENCRFRAMVGVGGIGTGVFFALDGDHTVGREESRSGRFIDRRDYCKLHIVAHYVKALLGPDFRVVPVGKVGADDAGGRLREEMAEAGLDMGYVESVEGVPTLFSFCFVYPDGSGGNFTTDDSACSRVTGEFVEGAAKVMETYRGAGIALAVPEAPLQARIRLLEMGTEYGFFRAASFSSKEIDEVVEAGVLGLIDLLALNIDEAARIVAADRKGAKKRPEGDGASMRSKTTAFSVGERARTADPASVAAESISVLTGLNPRLTITVTAGDRGSWLWDGVAISSCPASKVEVVSTAGAGDAYLAGYLSGVNAGLKLSEAQELATLVASLSVTSPHTIHREIDGVRLRDFAVRSRISMSKAVQEVLGMHASQSGRSLGDEI